MATKDWELLFKDEDEVVWVKNGKRLTIYELHKMPKSLERKGSLWYQD